MSNMLFKNGLAKKLYYKHLINVHGIVLGNGYIILLGLAPKGEWLSFSRHCIKITLSKLKSFEQILIKFKFW
jgi:hypothetical protein